MSTLAVAHASPIGKKTIEYRKDKKYKGPQEWGNYGPTAIRWYDYSSNESIDQSSAGIENNDAMIKRDRLKRYGYAEGEAERAPEVKKPEPLEIPDIEIPDYDGPDLIPDVDFSINSPNFWRTILIVFIFIAVIIALYFWLKNRIPRRNAPLKSEELNWNPQLVSQTELDYLLDLAIKRERYREAIRIYFTAILKELIRLKLIRWKKEKTNHHYQLELTGKSMYESFSKCAGVYELVWYGKYEINQAVFNELKPSLHFFYQQLKKVNVD